MNLKEELGTRNKRAYNRIKKPTNKLEKEKKIVKNGIKTSKSTRKEETI